MSNQFEFIGRLTIGKETEKFKPYEEKEFDSGWVKRTLKFNAICGDNRHMLEVDDGFWRDGHGDIYTFSKGSVDADGNKIKGEKITIPWGTRLKPESVAQVAEFKKFVIDLEEPSRRYKLEKAIEKFKEGNITDEELSELECDSLESLTTALETSKKKRKEFISGVDYAEFLHKLIVSEKVKDRKFRISGDYVVTEWKGKFYTHFYPSRIYLVSKDEAPKSEVNAVLYFNKAGLDINSFAEKGKYFVNAFIRNYDNQRKKDIPCPVMVSIIATGDEKAVKLGEIIKNQFVVDKKDKGMWKELGVKLNVLDGSQKMEITDDMLSELEQELLLLGEITLDDIRKEIGGDVYGERITENIVTGFSKGYLKGSKPTVYTDDNFILEDFEAPTKIDKANNTEKIEDEIDDIFDDIEI